MIGRGAIFSPLALVAGGLVLSLASPLQASSEDRAQNARLEAQDRHIATLQKMVHELRSRQTGIDDRVQKLERAREEVAELTGRVSALQEDLSGLQAKIEGIGADFADYRSSYKKFARIVAVGEKMPSLAANGKIYENVVIRRVTDTGLEIRHSGGSTRVQHDKLPLEIQERFQWDGELAEAVLAQEQKDEILRERLHAIVSDQKAKKQEEAERIAASERRIRDLEARMARVTSNSSSLDSAGKLGERRMVGSGRTYRYSRYRDRPTIYYYPVRNRVSRPSAAGRASHTPRPVPRTVRPQPPRRPSPAPMPRCPNGRD